VDERDRIAPAQQRPGLDRDLNVTCIDELLNEQGRIEFELGSTSPANTRRWLGLL
jgi:hypothetical protein